MNRFAFLDDIEDTLWNATQQTITEALAAGVHPEHRPAPAGCAWCGHAWHGLPCAPLTWGWSAEAGGWDWVYASCGCINADTPIDDTWRSPLDHDDDRDLQLMHDEGLDGWAAHASTASSACSCRPCSLRRKASITRRHRRTLTSVDQLIDANTQRARLDNARRNGHRAFVQALLDNGAQLVVHQGSVHTPGDTAARIEITGATEAFDQLVTIVRGSVISFGEAAERIREVIGAFGDRPVWPDIEPVDARARALAARQHRNTGPATPTAGHARRPRRHGAAR